MGGKSAKSRESSLRAISPPPAGVPKDYQAIEQLERDRAYDEQIQRSDAGSMIAHESSNLGTHSERTGERGTERDSAVLAGILSAPNEVGSLSRLLTATTLLRRSIVTYDESKDTAKIDRLLRALGNGCT